MEKQEIILANDEILSMDSFTIKEIFDDDLQEDLDNEQEQSMLMIRVEDPCKKGKYAQYEIEDFKTIVQLLEAYYQEIETAIEEIKEKNSEEYEENSEKIICYLVTRVISKYINQRKLVKIIDEDENKPLSCTYNKKAKNDKEYCFVLIEMLKRFGFKVGDAQGENASLGYIGFKDIFNENKEHYVCLVKLDNDWYALNRNGFITESSIKNDEGYNKFLKSTQDRIGYLCAKFNKSASIAKEGLKQEMVTRDDFTYMDSIKINTISNKENVKLRNLTNVDVESLEETTEIDGNQKKFQAKKKDRARKEEIKRQKDIKKIYVYAGKSIKYNDGRIEIYTKTLRIIKRIEEQIDKIDEEIERLETMKQAKKYGDTDWIEDRIDRLCERKQDLEDRLSDNPKDFYEKEIERLTKENENNRRNIEEHQDEVEAWRKDRSERRKEQLSRFVERISGGKLNITNPFNDVKTGNIDRERE